jgi:hypothetical protein
MWLCPVGGLLHEPTVLSCSWEDTSGVRLSCSGDTTRGVWGLQGRGRAAGSSNSPAPELGLPSWMHWSLEAGGGNAPVPLVQPLTSVMLPFLLHHLCVP